MMKRSVCIIAYANYYTDARIKNYVEALVKSGYAVDIFALGRLGGEIKKRVLVYF